MRYCRQGSLPHSQLLETAQREAPVRTFVVELGTGVDLHGKDATSAAIKAVRNAFAHVSLPGLRAVAGLDDIDVMRVEVRLGVPPGVEPVDAERVAAAFPHGQATVSSEPGGLLAPGGNDRSGDQILMVNAAIYVRVP
jgi:uncharacterized protein (TIGR02058 family)